ncbi:hypothetical protein DPMN_182057 [Dreissena polymorpha]|uniref:Uncharacterized protein n=1 Tax=Dreissena polymorpha TaxID=45954 RepID=A0A9D4DE12_DREPO|nr:hypothetical protein DPMN_182057 [Dreissena polymorpha]
MSTHSFVTTSSQNARHTGMGVSNTVQGGANAKHRNCFSNFEQFVTIRGSKSFNADWTSSRLWWPKAFGRTVRLYGASEHVNASWNGTHLVFTSSMIVAFCVQHGKMTIKVTVAIVLAVEYPRCMFLQLFNEVIKSRSGKTGFNACALSVVPD